MHGPRVGLVEEGLAPQALQWGLVGEGQLEGEWGEGGWEPRLLGSREGEIRWTSL